MAVKFFKDYKAAEAARVIEITPDVYGSSHGWCMVVIRVGDTSIEVSRKDFDTFTKEFSRAAVEAIAEYDRQIEKYKEPIGTKFFKSKSLSTLKEKK